MENKCFSDVMSNLKREKKFEEKKFAKRWIRTRVVRIKKGTSPVLPSAPPELTTLNHLL